MSEKIKIKIKMGFCTMSGKLQHVGKTNNKGTSGHISSTPGFSLPNQSQTNHTIFLLISALGAYEIALGGRLTGLKKIFKKNEKKRRKK